MNTQCNFTFHHYKDVFKMALEKNYQVIRLKDFFLDNYDKSRKAIINRVDVDFEIERTKSIGQILKELGIFGSFFFRLHAKQYNLFSFNNFNVVKWLIKNGNEIGLHSEIIDMEYICKEDPVVLLKKEISTVEEFFNTKIYGVASHGDNTGYNNLDFWKSHVAGEFGLLYEAYDEQLLGASRYVSDSEFTRWKAYENQKLLAGDRRCACEHIKEGVTLIYLLTHPCSYYWKHFHE